MAETCVFVKQSLGPFHCGPVALSPQGLQAPGHPFSRSYGVILPSSLTRVLSRALAFYARLPVSVCGTVIPRLARGFSWQPGLIRLGWPKPPFLTLLRVLLAGRICLPSPPTSMNAHPAVRRFTLLRHLIASLSPRYGAGISTGCPSPTPFGLGLGPAKLRRTNLP